MQFKSRPLAGLLSAGTAIIAACALANAATAAPVITSVGADYSTTPFTFSLGDSSFTFSGTGDWFAPTAVQTGGTGQINSIFGSPTSYFVDRGTVTFGADKQYTAFGSATTINYSNSNNFIGLRATSGSDVFYGFAFTTDNILNSYGFENVAGREITATVASGAVPEPASWVLMLSGFGLVGGTLRRRKAAVSFA
jgi:acetyl esterase/lipase